MIAERTRATRPLRSARITGHHRYYRTVRLPAPRQYSPPHSYRCLGFSLSPANPTLGRPCRGEGFPRFVLEPEPSSRHLYAGHHQANKQAPAWLVPGQQRDPGFDVVPTLSTDHQWFTHVRLLGSHLTHLVRLFRVAHHHGSFTAAAHGGLRPPPTGRSRRAIPPSPAQHRIQKIRLLHRTLLQRSWHTVIAVPLKPHGHVIPGKPGIQRIVQEEIRQQRRYRRALWSPLDRENKTAIGVLDRRDKPPPHIQHHPREICVLLHCGNDFSMRDIVEEPLNVKTVLAHRLILDLLDSAGRTGPVPVLFSLSDWNPASTGLRHWMVRRLVRDFPFLNSRDPTTGILLANPYCLVRQQDRPRRTGFSGRRQRETPANTHQFAPD